MRASLLLVALALLAVAPRAQVEADCDPNELGAPSAYSAEWEALHPDRVLDGLDGPIGRGEWGAAGEALASSFRTSSRVPPGPARDALQAHLDSAAAELRAVEGRPGDAALSLGVDLDRFTVDTFDFVLFPDTDDAVDLEPLDADVRRAVCWRAFAADGVLSLYGRQGRKVAVEALDEALALWARYNETSYSQYPWELVVNGLLSGPPRVEALEDLHPPRTQVVFMHPGVALEAAGFTDGLSELRRLDVLTFEPLGLLRYNASRTSYLGASLLVTIASDAAPGVGGLVHLGDGVQIGAVYRDAGDDGRGSGLVLSLDVFKLISGVPASTRQRVEAMRAQAEAFAEALAE